MRLAEDECKVLNKIVENTTIDELLEEANIQAGYMARILSKGNRQHGISAGSRRIAGDIAVNLGIIYILVGAATKYMRTEDTVILFADDSAESADTGKVYDIDDMLHNLIGSTMGLQVYREENGREFLKQYVDDLDNGFRDAARALIDQLLEITDKVLGIKKKDYEEMIRKKIQKFKEQLAFIKGMQKGKNESLQEDNSNDHTGLFITIGTVIFPASMPVHAAETWDFYGEGWYKLNGPPNHYFLWRESLRGHLH